MCSETLDKTLNDHLEEIGTVSDITYYGYNLQLHPFVQKLDWLNKTDTHCSVVGYTYGIIYIQHTMLRSDSARKVRYILTHFDRFLALIIIFGSREKCVRVVHV